MKKNFWLNWARRVFWFFIMVFFIVGGWLVLGIIYYLFKYPEILFIDVLKNWIIQFVGWTLGFMTTTGCCLYSYFKRKAYFKKQRHYADSQWMTKKEWQSLTLNSNFPSQIHSGGWVVQTKIKTGQIRFRSVTYCNSLVVGSTGGGKTQKIVLPNILFNLASSSKPTLIITDPKGALWQLLPPYLKKYHYQHYYLDFENFSGDHWNPLIYIFELWIATQYDQAEKELILYVDTVFPTPKTISDPFWHQSAKKLIRGIILGLMIEKITFNPQLKNHTILPQEIHYKISQPRTVLLEWLSVLVQNNPRMKLCLGALIYENEKTLSSIINQADTEVARLSFGLFNKMCARNDIDFEQICTKPTVVVIRTSTIESPFYFLAQLFIEHINAWLFQPRFLKNEHSVLFILEEFGVIPPIKAFNQVLANCREYNFWFLMIIQYHQQLARYRDIDGIDANTDLKYFFRNQWLVW